jgi:hypothetical protein
MPTERDPERPARWARLRRWVEDFESTSTAFVAFVIIAAIAVAILIVWRLLT